MSAVVSSSPDLGLAENLGLVRSAFAFARVNGGPPSFLGPLSSQPIILIVTSLTPSLSNIDHRHFFLYIAGDVNCNGTQK